MNEIVFDHEKLIVYQKSVEFVKWVHQILIKIKLKNSTIDQFERAADSITLNIAEGNGKYSEKTVAVILILQRVQAWNVHRVWIYC